MKRSPSYPGRKTTQRDRSARLPSDTVMAPAIVYRCLICSSLSHPRTAASWETLIRTLSVPCQNCEKSYSDVIVSNWICVLYSKGHPRGRWALWKSCRSYYILDPSSAALELRVQGLAWSWVSSPPSFSREQCLRCTVDSVTGWGLQLWEFSGLVPWTEVWWSVDSNSKGRGMVPPFQWPIGTENINKGHDVKNPELTS